MTLTDKNKVTAKSRNKAAIVAGVIGLILLWWFYPQIRAAMDPVREASSVEDAMMPAAETSDAAAEPKPTADIETATDSPNREDAASAPELATSEAAPEEAVSESQSAEASSAAPAEPLSSKLAAPKFDVVRIETDGSALIAGQADGRGYVVLSVDGVEQPEARADLSGNGQFVIFAFLPSTADQQSLKLHLYAEDGSGPVASVQTVFVAPATAVSSGTESAAAAVEEEVAASEDPEAESEMASTEAKSTNLEAAAAQAANADAAPVAEAMQLQWPRRLRPPVLRKSQRPRSLNLKPSWRPPTWGHPTRKRLQRLQRSFLLMRMACGFCRTGRPLRSRLRLQLTQFLIAQMAT